VTFLPTEPFYFRDREPLNANLAKGLPYFVNLERFDYCGNQLHDLVPLMEGMIRT
jgi:hypothetical protein